MKIVIDAGHGRNTAGKRCLKSLDPNETREWVLNARVAEFVTAMLKAYDVEVLRTDDPTGEKDVPLKTRTDAANKAGANFFLSIHHNAGMNGKSGGGVEVLCYDTNTAALAWDLYRCVTTANHLYGNRSDKVLTRPDLAVLRRTTMPALLLENGFMDSSYDCPIIRTEEHARKTAEGIVNFLAKTLLLQKKSADMNDKGNYYIVAAEGISKDAADYLIILLHEAGFKDAKIKEATQ